MKHLPLLALCLAASWVGASPAAPQRQESPVLSARTDLVTLAVTVVDRKGRYVTGLRQDHFTVFDDGDRQEIQLFTSEDLAATVGLLVDSSASMRDERDRVTAAATAFAAMRNPLDQFFTVNFNEHVWLGLPPPHAFTADVELLRAALAAAPAQGMTALYDAIFLGLDHLQHGAHDRKALIVVSDGGDNASTQTLDAALERARRLNAVIYGVVLADLDDREADPRVLKTLAGQTGGRAFTPETPDEVMEALSEVAQELRSGYTIGFAPAPTVEAGFRAVRVVADAGDGRRLVVRTRAGYYASPPGGTTR